MRHISLGEHVEIASFTRDIQKSYMAHKHIQSTKGPYNSVIFKSKTTNQMIRYKHRGQFSAKIMLEQKADFLKFDSN